jgi:hypothetical protein
LRQFGAEEFRARRIVEGECRQRIEHPVMPHSAAEVGFHADDRQHVLRLNMPAQRYLIEQFAMLAPQAHARLDALVGQKVRAVFPPGHGLLGRLGHRLDNPRLRFSLRQGGSGCGAINPLRTELIEKTADFRAAQIKMAAGRRRRIGAAGGSGN